MRGKEHRKEHRSSLASASSVLRILASGFDKSAAEERKAEREYTIIIVFTSIQYCCTLVLVHHHKK